MPGTLNSGRPGGNPDLKKYQFKAKGDEPLNQKLTLRLTGSMMEFLKSLGKDYPNFVREAIAEKIERETKTETTGQD
ncbi:MAG: hypothetical protein AAF316_04455 [Cyanobacteria bacterium P01_A01_bin.80]